MIKVYKEQIVFFFKKGSSFKTFELSMALYNKLKNVFKNSQPTVLPVPDDAPDDMPRCVWNDYNTKLSYSLQSLTVAIDIPSTHNWLTLAKELTDLIASAYAECEISIDRIGIIAETNTETDLHKMLQETIGIPQFTCETEANVSWLDHMGIYNVWTYLTVDVPHEINKIVYDVNNQAEYKLSEQGISVQTAIKGALDVLKGRIDSGV